MDFERNVIALATRLGVSLEEYLTGDESPEVLAPLYLKLLNALGDQYAAPPKEFIVSVGGVDVNLTGISAITLGDKKTLKKAGVDFVKFARERNVEPEDEVTMILHILKKRRGETTAEEVENIPVVTSARIIQYFWTRSAEVDDPFSQRLTTSGQPTGGVSAKSA